MQFVAQAGYNVCLPCPESPAYSQPQQYGALNLLASPDIRVHRNGFSGSVHLVAQRFIDGIGLVPILRCGGCGSMWREVDSARIEALAVAFRSMADADKGDAQAKFYHAIADRILAGIEVEVR